MTKHPIALAIALVFATSAALSGCDRTSNLTEQEHIQRAKDFEDKGNLKASVVELKNALQKNPGNAQARLLLGQIYIKINEGEQAEKELRKALELGAGKESVNISLGQALLLQHEYKRALQEVRPTEQTSAQNRARILQLHGDAQLGLGKLQEGCELYKQSLATAPNLAEIHTGLAKCAAVNKNFDQARSYLTHALQLDAKNIEAWLLLGDVENLVGNKEKSIEAYGKAIEFAPYNPIARYSMAVAQMNAGRLDAAQQEISQLRKQHPSLPAGLNGQALLDYRRQNYAAAADNASQVLKNLPDNPISLLIYGASQYELGNYEQAISYLNRVVNMRPGNLFARKLLASTLLHQNQPQRALDVLKPAVSGAAEDSNFLALVAQAYLKLGQHAEATVAMEKAMALSPGNAPLRAGLGITRLAEGNITQGLSDLESAAGQSGSPYQTDLALISELLRKKDYERALPAIARLDSKLPANPVVHKLMGAAYLGKGDRINARKSFEKSLTLNPAYFPAALELGKMDIADNNPLAARKRYESILKADPKNVMALMALAALAKRDKQTNTYLSYLDKARNADPKALPARVELAWHYIGAREPQKAMQMANEAAINNPGNMHALDLLGAIQLAAGNKDDALATYNKMAALFPNSFLAHYRLANVQALLQKNTAAMASLNKSLQLKPDHLQAQLLLASLQVSAGKANEAMKVAHQIQTQAGNAKEGYMLEGDLWLAQKEYGKAVLAYTEVLKRERSGSAAMRKLHAAMTGMGNGKAADAKIIQWLQERPDDSGVRHYYAESLFKQGRFPAAVAEYQRLLATNPKDVVALNNLAELYRFQKNPRAVEYAERAFSLRPNDPNIADTLGWLLVETGNLRRAVPILKQAVAQSPDAITIRYHLAVAYEKSGDRSNARKEVEQVLRAKTNPPFPQIEEARKMLRRLDV